MHYVSGFYQKLFDTLWPMTTPSQCLGWLVAILIHLFVLWLLVCFLSELANYGNAINYHGHGTVIDAQSKHHEAEVSAQSDGELVETGPYTSYKLTISYDGWTCEKYVTEREYNRHPKYSGIGFLYQVGRIHKKRRIVGIKMD